MPGAVPHWVVWWSTSELCAARMESVVTGPVVRAWNTLKGDFATPAAAIAGWRGLGISEDAALTLVPDDLGPLTKQLVVPVVSANQQAETIASEVRQALPGEVELVQWDTLLLGDDGIEQEHLLVAAQRSKLDLLGAALEPSRYRPESVTQAFALELTSVLEKGGENRLVVHLGRISTHLIFYGAGGVHLRTVKVGCGSGEDPAPLATRLRAEIVRTTASLRRQSADSAPEAIEVHGVPEAAALASPLATAVGLPLISMDRSHDPDGLVGAGAPLLPIFAGAVWALSKPTAERINLMPENLRRQEAARATSRWAVVAGLLFVVGCAAWSAGEWLATRSLEDRVEALRRTILPVAASMDAIRAEMQTFDDAVAQVRGLEGLARSRTNWIEFLSDLQTRLVAVEDVWIDRMIVARSAEPVEVEERPPWELPDPAEVATPAPAQYELQLEGRMIDRRNPLARVSADMRGSVSDLLDRFGESAFVEDVADKRFDTSEKGILRFSFTLRINPQMPL